MLKRSRKTNRTAKKGVIARVKTVFNWAFRLIAGAIVALFLLILLFRWVPVPVTSFMIQDRVASIFSKEKTDRFKYQWVPLTKISRQLQRAAVASEDQLFADHYGFDFNQIEKAFKERQRSRKKRFRGASTITQQVAKNLFLWPGNSWVRKGLEAGITVLLELTWPKKRILEVYLNIAEFGQGVWGAEAAAKHFYRKPAATLNKEQAAMMITVLPAPKKMRIDKPTAYMLRRQQWIMRQMGRIKLVD
jgi:monofunctional biosynthetic peptidoglycan transglycosylase